MKIRHGVLLGSLGAFMLAAGAGIAVEAARGSLGRAAQSGEAGGDGPFYISLARSMAAGRGYVSDNTPWPNSPHLSRLPLWPWLLQPRAGCFLRPATLRFCKGRLFFCTVL